MEESVRVSVQRASSLQLSFKYAVTKYRPLKRRNKLGYTIIDKVRNP